MNNKKIIWLTGQPGSGKTTIANSLKDYFEKINDSNIVVIVDGDDLREITINKDYSKNGRVNNIKTAQKIAKFLFNKDFITIVALVAPYKELREQFKSSTPVFEVYLHTDEIRGREHFFANDYEKPENDYLSIDTGGKSVSESVEIIYQNLK